MVGRYSTITQHVTSLSRMEDYDRICHLSNWRWFTIRWYTLVYALKYKQLLSALLKVTQSFIWCTRQNIKICKRLREKHPPYLFFLKETRNPNHWTEDSRRRSYDVTSVSRMETSDDRVGKRSNLFDWQVSANWLPRPHVITFCGRASYWTQGLHDK